MTEVIEITLEEDPNIRIAESRLNAARGAALVSSGRFDAILLADATAVDAREPTSESESTSSESRSQSTSLSWPLRSGQILSPSLELQQVVGEPGLSTGTFSFTVRQPLLQGRGREAITAEEEASFVEIEASRLDFVHRVAQRLLAATNQYWAARAARFDVDVLRDAELRSSQLLETTKRLVEADLTPAAELIQLEADLVFRQANRIAGERALVQTFQELAATLGLGATQSPHLGLPSDEFPSVDPATLPASAEMYLAAALLNRADLGADRARLDAARLRLANAHDSLRPQLDLVFTPSVTGLIEDDGLGDALTAVGSHVPGVSANLSLRFSFPIPNRVAEGDLILSTETVRQQELLIESSSIQIAADVRSAHDAVRSDAERVQVLEHSVELFRETLENEEKKLRVGSATLIDVINQTDRFTAAQQRLVEARLSLAQALATLRFATGTLVRPDGTGAEAVDVGDLTTIPRGDW
ncbi:MAG: TolC family protein [Acidobacteriota bacterium]